MVVSLKNELLQSETYSVKSLLRRYRYIFLLLLIMAVSFGLYVPKYGLIYDGGLYASLGYSLQHDGSYVFNGAPGDVPPAYSVFLAFSILLLGEKGIFTVTPFFSALLICTVFFIFRREFDEEIAFLGALLVLFNPPIFFYAVQVVRDLPLMAFVMLSYLLFLKEERGKMSEMFLGVMMGLAFLTTYAAIVYLLPIFIHAIYTRKTFKIPLIAALILLLPWMAWSYANHGSFLVSHSSYLTKEIGKDIGRFFTFIVPLLVRWSFPPMFLIFFFGVTETLKKDRLNPLVLLLVLSLIMGVLWPEKEIRYVFFTILLIVYFALVFLSRFKKSHVMIFLLIVLVFQGYSTYTLVEANTYQDILFEDAGHWLRDNTPEDARILSYSYRQVNYFSHRVTFQPPKEVDKVEGFIGQHNVNYAVVDTYAKYTPAYMYTYLDRYKLLKTFQRGSHEIRIYELTNPSQLTVILSFDFESPDGADKIPLILEVLKEHKANATFFVTGATARDYPEIVRGIKDAGYEIGSHGYNHEFPIFEKEDAELFAEIFNRSFDYEWNRSVKSVENFEYVLKESREWIKNATGLFPRSYRSPILTPSLTKDMRYIDVVEKVGFTIDSSILRRSMVEETLERPTNVKIVPASFSDAELKNKEFILHLAREHSSRDEPLVVFFHPWRFSEEGHFENFENFLDEIESRYLQIEYMSIEGYVAEERGQQNI
jgi:peptidoglycan/xylan/chitin deacetylase (PgdA/CDA1 family)